MAIRANHPRRLRRVFRYMALTLCCLMAVACLFVAIGTRWFNAGWFVHRDDGGHVIVGVGRGMLCAARYVPECAPSRKALFSRPDGWAMGDFYVFPQRRLLSWSELAPVAVTEEAMARTVWPGSNPELGTVPETASDFFRWFFLVPAFLVSNLFAIWPLLVAWRWWRRTGREPGESAPVA